MTTSKLTYEGEAHAIALRMQSDAELIMGGAEINQEGLLMPMRDQKDTLYQEFLNRDRINEVEQNKLVCATKLVNFFEKDELGVEVFNEISFYRELAVRLRAGTIDPENHARILDGWLEIRGTPVSKKIDWEFELNGLHINVDDDARSLLSACNLLALNNDLYGLEGMPISGSTQIPAPGTKRKTKEVSFNGTLEKLLPYMCVKISGYDQASVVPISAISELHLAYSSDDTLDPEDLEDIFQYVYNRKYPPAESNAEKMPAYDERPFTAERIALNGICKILDTR